MKKIIKKISILALALVLTFGMTVSAFADQSSVTYEGDADQFVFLPGSAYSPTDLFTNFKGVMPGDTLSQNIEVKNVTSDEYKVVLYMKALGASDLKDNEGNEVVSYEDSADFLKEMTLTVTAESGAEYFNAYANETAGLTDWVCLGEFFYGGNVNLRVDLLVPITMGNDFQNRIGALQWVFQAVEIPEDETPNPHPGEDETTTGTGDPTDGTTKPDSAKTGDSMNIVLMGSICIAALAIILVLLFTRRRKTE